MFVRSVYRLAPGPEGHKRVGLCPGAGRISDKKARCRRDRESQRKAVGCPAIGSRPADRILRPRRLADPGRQGFHRRHFKQGRQRQPFAERVFDFRKDAHRHERVAAKLEEVVRDADRLEPERFFPDGHQLGFERVPRRHRSFFGLQGDWHRERAPVQLAVGRQGQRLEHHKGRGHHVAGEPVGEAAAKRSRFGYLPRCSHHVGHQLLAIQRRPRAQSPLLARPPAEP